MLTVQQAAVHLGINQDTVYQAMREGRLTFVEALGRKVIKRADLEAYEKRTRADGEKPKGRPKGSKNQTKLKTEEQA